MGRNAINTFCAALPGAEVSDPWGGGHDAWKVGGKMFASMGVSDDGVSVKCGSVGQAEMLIDAGIGVKAPYFHRSWIRLSLDADPAEVQHRIIESYRLVREALPKKVQAGLAPIPQAET